MRLNILRSRDRYLVERISNLVRVQLRAEVNSSRTEREIRAIFDSSKNDVYQKLIGYGSRSRQDVYDDLGSAAHFDTLHLDVIMDFFVKEIRRSLKEMGPSHQRDLVCARLLAMPSIDRDIIEACSKSGLNSIYLAQSNLDASWKKKLRLSFSDFANLPYEERACAYRDFRRATYLFEDISGIGRRQNLPGSRY
jgi:hypothetical protein